MAMRITDQKLLQEINQGSEAAFSALAGRYVPLLRSYLSRTLPALHVDDVLQETLVAVFRGAGGFEGEDSAKAWILGIARRCSARAMRRRVGEPAHTSPLPELGMAAGWGNPEDQASWKERLLFVDKALNSMSAPAAEVIILRDVEGLSAPEAAALLEISVDALKSRLHRARLELMEKLHKEDI